VAEVHSTYIVACQFRRNFPDHLYAQIVVQIVAPPLDDFKAVQYCTEVARQALTRRSKGQRSRSHFYENRHVYWAASGCWGRSATAAGVWLHVVRLLGFLVDRTYRCFYACRQTNSAALCNGSLTRIGVAGIDSNADVRKKRKLAQ